MLRHIDPRTFEGGLKMRVGIDLAYDRTVLSEQAVDRFHRLFITEEIADGAVFAQKAIDQSSILEKGTDISAWAGSASYFFMLPPFVILDLKSLSL